MVTIPNAEEDAEKPHHSHIADVSVKQDTHSGNTYGSFLQI